MYEELYAGLEAAEREAYLRRIGIGDLPRIDRESLDRLVLAHQCAVPFENLDVCELGRDVSLATKELFEKVVTRRRGGYCFELNALFYQLLRAVGFDAVPCLARVVRDPSFLAPPLHRVTLVNLDGQQYFCDVGFGGPMPGTSLELLPEKEQRSLEDVFFFTPLNDHWVTLHKKNGGQDQAVLVVCTVPQEQVDFIAPNEFCFRTPGSFFRAARLVNLRLPGGAAYITNDMFYKNAAGEKTERKIESRRELDEILRAEFGLELPLSGGFPAPGGGTSQS